MNTKPDSKQAVLEALFNAHAQAIAAGLEGLATKLFDEIEKLRLEGVDSFESSGAELKLKRYPTAPPLPSPSLFDQDLGQPRYRWGESPFTQMYESWRQKQNQYYWRQKYIPPQRLTATFTFTVTLTGNVPLNEPVIVTIGWGEFYRILYLNAKID